MGLVLMVGCAAVTVPTIEKQKNAKSCKSNIQTQQAWSKKQKLAYIAKHTSNQSFKDIVVDKYGNSYVMKHAKKLVKYNCQWQKVWEMKMPVKNAMTMTALDIDDKYFYLVGSGNTYSPSKNGVSTVTSYRYLSKYDLNGYEIWQTKEKNKNSVLNGNTILKDMAVSKDGSVYVIGHNILDASGYIDKYNTHGKLLWHKAFKGMKFYALNLDKNQNVCIVGETANESLISKYNSKGQNLWTKLIPLKNSSNIILFQDLSIDKYNNVYALGYGYEQVSYIFKFSPDGKSVWKVKTPIGTGGSILCGVDAKVYLAGQELKPKIYNGNGKNLTVAVYDTKGKLLGKNLQRDQNTKDTLVHKYSFYRVYKRESGRLYVVQNGQVLYDDLKYVALKKKLPAGNEVVMINGSNQLQKVLIKSDEVQTDLLIGNPPVLMCGNGIRSFKTKAVTKANQIEIILQDITSDNEPKKNALKVATISKRKADRLFFQNNKSQITYMPGSWFSDNTRLNSDYLFFQKGNQYGFLGEIVEKYKKNKPVAYYLKKSKDKKLYEELKLIDNNYLLLKRKGLYGYYNTTKIKYKSIGKFVDNLARIELLDGRKGYVDTKGNEYYD